MRKQVLTSLLAALTFSACQQEDLLSENVGRNQEQTAIDGIQVVDGYLNFASDDLFQSYLVSLKNENNNSTVSTRTAQQGFKGFTSINSLKEHVANTRSGESEDAEEGTEDEYRVSIAEERIKDNILYNVLDTTLRISIGNMFYKIAEQGTFYCPKEYAEEINNTIAEFDISKVTFISDNLYSINDKFYFYDTFGIISGDKTIMNLDATEIIADENMTTTRATAFGENNYNSSYYNLNTYKWEAKTALGWCLSKLLGQDISKEKEFDSKHRVQCELFQVNYVFYASTGFKVRMQKRKKILFIKYWVSTNADDIVVGIERLSGKMNFNYNPGVVYSYATFTHTWQGITNNMVYGGLSKPTFIEDYITDNIVTIFPGIKEFNFLKWNIDPWSWNQTLTKDAIYEGLNFLTGRIAKKAGKKLAIEDPRIAMVMNKRGEAETHFMGGARSYGSGSSQTIRFSQSAGFSYKLGGAVIGYIPEKFAITDASIWGAVKYGGKWKGIRFTYTEK